MSKFDALTEPERLPLPKRLRAAIENYEIFIETKTHDEARKARQGILRLLRAMGVNRWDHFILAKHGMKSSMEEIRSGRVPNCSIGPDGSVRCHALTLVP